MRVIADITDPGGVLYRGKNSVSARLSTTGLDTNAS